MAPYACIHFRLSHIFPPRSLAAPLAGLLAVAALLWLLPIASAHGLIAEPASRNLMRDWQNCPQCVNGGGTWPSSGEGRLRWPRTAQPVSACGGWCAAQAGEAQDASCRRCLDVGLSLPTCRRCAEQGILARLVPLLRATGREKVCLLRDQLAYDMQGFLGGRQALTPSCLLAHLACPFCSP